MLDNLWSVTRTLADGITEETLIFEKDTHADNTALYLDQSTIDDLTLPPQFIQLKRVKPKQSVDFYGTRRFFATIRTEAVLPQPTGPRMTPMITYINGTRAVGFSPEQIAQHDKLCRALLLTPNWDKFTVRGEI